MNKTTSDERVPPLSPDRALTDPAEDRLGYAPFSKQLASGILRGCPADGLVVAVYGEWGTGKSTALNFILHYLEQDPEGEAPVVVRFNPWWFAGQEDLVRRFFDQFEATLFKAKAGRRKLRKKVAAFSEALASVPIPYVASGAKAVKSMLSENADIVALKAELTQELAREATRIIVVVDDIDRLAADEIRQLFQVIKAVADFPNVIYLLAFDREAVAKALDSTASTRGADYLEKIVQVQFDLPSADRSQLQALLFERLDRLIGENDAGSFDQERWVNIYFDGIDPLIEKPRDVVRLTNALSVTYPALAGDVDVVDLIAIETLRLFCPRAYDVIRSNHSMFTGIGEHEDKEAQRKFHNTWLNQIAERREAVQTLVRKSFPRLESVWSNTIHGRPALKQWRKRLRVCSPEFFSTYFRFSLPDGEVPANEIRAILNAETTGTQLAERLRQLATQSRPDGHSRATSLLMRLSDQIDRNVPRDTLVRILLALFAAGDDVIAHGKLGAEPFDPGEDVRIGWVVQAILKRLTREERSVTLKRAFVDGQSLVTLARELAYLGRQHGKWGAEEIPEPERYIDAQTLEDLEQRLRTRVEAAGADGTIWLSARPQRLLEVWLMLGEPQAMREALAVHLRDDKALLDFLRGFIRRQRRRFVTERAVRVKLHLDPQDLADYVDVGQIAARVDALLAGAALTPEQREELEAFARGKKARDAGSDPLEWRFREADDDD